MPEVGEHLFGRDEGERFQVGTGAEEVLNCSTRLRDPDGFGDYDGGRVDPFVVGGDEDDHIAAGDAAGFVEAQRFELVFRGRAGGGSLGWTQPFGYVFSGGAGLMVGRMFDEYPGRRSG